MGEDLRVHHGEKLTLRAWSSGSCATGRPSGTGREGFSAGRTSPSRRRARPRREGSRGRFLLFPPSARTSSGRGGRRSLRGFPPPLPRASGDPLRSAGGGPLGDPGPPLQGGPPKVPGLPPPGGESLSAFQERVFRFLEGLKAPAVLFTHGGWCGRCSGPWGRTALCPREARWRWTGPGGCSSASPLTGRRQRGKTGARAAGVPQGPDVLGRKRGKTGESPALCRNGNRP